MRANLGAVAQEFMLNGQDAEWSHLMPQGHTIVPKEASTSRLAGLQVPYERSKTKAALDTLYRHRR